MITRNIISGFDPKGRAYAGENIFHVRQTRELSGTLCLLLENGQWIRRIGADRYITDWNADERWGRVVEIETDETAAEIASKELGFAILRVSRAENLRLNAPAKPSARVNTSLCTGCRICVKGCPVYAISVKARKAQVAEACTGCGACEKLCPFDAIHATLA